MVLWWVADLIDVVRHGISLGVEVRIKSPNCLALLFFNSRTYLGIWCGYMGVCVSMSSSRVGCALYGVGCLLFPNDMAVCSSIVYPDPDRSTPTRIPDLQTAIGIAVL